jgi:hypothetical protein
MYRKMADSQVIDRTNYHEYYYHVIDKEKYDEYYPEPTIDINEQITLSLLDPDGKRIGTNYKKKIDHYIREGFGAYVKSRNNYWKSNGVKLYFTGKNELDNKLKDLNIELYKIENMEDLKEVWDKIKKDSTFKELKDISKSHHSIDRTLDFENLNDTNVGRILCHIATIPTYNIFMKEMKNINDKEDKKDKEELLNELWNECLEYTKDLKIDHPANDLVKKLLSDISKKNYIGVNAGNRKTRRNRKSKKGKRSRKARKSRRKSNRRRR